MHFTGKNLMLATAIKGEPKDYRPSHWLAQPKWDGHRMVITKDLSATLYVKRSSSDMLQPWGDHRSPGNQWFPSVCGWTLDGEWLPNNGLYVVFDVLEWDGVDLRGTPLEKRLDHLNSITKLLNYTQTFGNGRAIPRVMVSPYGEPDLVMAVVQKHGMEGTMLKRRNSPYTAGRSANWQKFVRTQTATWSFYVKEDESKLVLTKDTYEPIRVAVSDEVAAELRRTLGKHTVTHWYPRPDHPVPSANGVFRFWGWKRTRIGNMPRYVQYVELSDVPLHDGYLMIDGSKANGTIV